MTPRKPVRARMLVYAAVLAIVFGAALHAQAIIGTWQGTLPAGDAPRIVLKFIKAEDGSLHGTLLFIDRGATGVPLLSTTFAPPDLNVAIADISYRGKLSADGKSIAGIWTRGGQSSPLTLVLATPGTLWTYAGPAALPPMAATVDPAFEVAAIKPSRPGANYGGYSARTRQFQARGATVARLISIAYQVRDRQIDGGPSRMNEDKFDVVAEPDAPGLPSLDQQRVMLRKLLAERFGLKVHMVEREFPVYALTVVKSPPKVTASDPSGNGDGSVYVRDGKDGQTAVQCAFMTMPELADLLMNFQDRQVVDETGLKGRYNFTLMIPTNTAYGRQGPDEMDKATAYFNAVQPLGFKLVPKKEPLEVVVIDHVDQPSPN